LIHIEDPAIYPTFHVAQEPQKDLMVNGLGIESKTYGRVEPRALMWNPISGGKPGPYTSKHRDLTIKNSGIINNSWEHDGNMMGI